MKRSLYLFFVLMLSAGCSTFSLNTSTHSEVETRIFVGSKCNTKIPDYMTPEDDGTESASFASSIALPLVKLAAGAGYDTVVGSIKSAGSKRVSVTRAKKNLTLHESTYKKESLPTCIHIVRGKFSTPSEGDTFYEKYRSKVGKNEYTLAVKEKPELALEILILSVDEKSIVFQPISFMYQGKMVHNRKVVMSDDLKIYLGISPPNVDESGVYTSSGKNHALIDFKDLKNQTKKLFSNENYIDDLYQSSYFQGTKESVDNGLAIYATIIESKEGNAFFKNFASSLEDDQSLKDGINVFIDSSKILKSRGENLEEEKTDSDERITNLQTYIQKRVEVEQAIETHKAACSNSTASDEEKNGKEKIASEQIRNLNILANKLSLPIMKIDVVEPCG